MLCRSLVQRAKKNVMKFGEMYLHSDLILTKCTQNSIYSATVRLNS